MRTKVSHQSIAAAVEAGDKAFLDLVHALRGSGRTVRPGAIRRLVAYWRRQTPLTTWDVCSVLRDGLMVNGRVSMRQFGWK
jgi:hypothetical protein